MTAFKSVSGSILALLLPLGCDLFQDSSNMKGEIQVLVKQFAEAAQTDVNGMLAMYDAGPGTVSIGNGEIQRGIEDIRKSADTNLISTVGKFKYDLGSIEVTPLGSGYALAVTPFVIRGKQRGRESFLDPAGLRHSGSVPNRISSSTEGFSPFSIVDLFNAGLRDKKMGHAPFH